jgi:thiol-disulfide isomerase/thioredoxin
VSGRKSSFVSLFGLFLVTVVALAACTGAATTTDSGTGAAGKLSGQTNFGADFGINLYTGQEIIGVQEISYSDLFASGKPVVLNVWASGCPPCRLEMPDFQEVSVERAVDVMIFGLDVGPVINLGTSDQARALVQQLGITYPTGGTTDATAVREMKIIGMPTTLFISPEGEVVKRWTGLLDKGQLSQFIAEFQGSTAN